MPTDHRYPPQDAYLHVLSWLRDEIYPGLVGHPLDDRGIAAWVCDRFHVLYQTYGLEDAKHRLYEEIARVVHPPPAPDPGSRVLAPIRGHLRVVNDTFVDDTGPRCVCLCHAGNLFLEYTKDHDKALRALDEIAAAGYHGIRVWTRLRGAWWRERSGEVGHEVHGSDLWVTSLMDFLGSLEERQLVAHVAAGDLAHLGRVERAFYFDALSNLCAVYGPTIVLAEWANESRDTAGGLNELDAWNDMQPVRDRARCLTALTAYTGHEDRDLFHQWTPASQQFVLVHGYRGGHWWDKLRHIFSLPYEDKTRRLYWQGEPFGVGPRVSAIANQHELTAEVMALAAAQCWITGGGAWTFMSSPGVILGDERFADQPGFYETPRVAAALEQVQRQYGLEWGRMRLMHGGTGRPNVFTIVGGDETSRIDQAIDDEKGIVLATVYGERRFIGFGFSEKWDVDLQWLNLSTGEWSNEVYGVFPAVVLGVRA